MLHNPNRTRDVSQLYKIAGRLGWVKHQQIADDDLNAWVDEKWALVKHLMLKVLEGEKAYHSATPIEENDFQSLFARFAATIARTVDWKGIPERQEDLKKECSLMTHLKDDVEFMSWVQPFVCELSDEDEAMGSITWYEPGCTYYSLSTDSARIPDPIDAQTLTNLIPPLRVANGELEDEDDVDEKTAQMEQRACVILQHHTALCNMLKTWYDSDSHFKEFAVWTDTDNTRCVLMQRAAWLIIEQTEALWYEIDEHAADGEIEEEYIGEVLPALEIALLEMVKVAVSVQVDGSREIERYKKTGACW